MDNIKDIWFKTSKTLEELGKILEVKDFEYDCENYWEWIIGNFNGQTLDITRTHTKSAKDVDTRIFVYEDFLPPINEESINMITKRLKENGITPIFLGEWKYLTGNEFEKQETIKIEA